MPKEIEHKFLVLGPDYRGAATRHERLQQAYLAASGKSSIRIRLGRDGAWLNIKSATLSAVRDEYDYAIPREDGQEILERLAVGGVIDKTRFWVPYGGMVWEVDEFHGDNEGLVVAEIELERDDQTYACPPWVGRDVTQIGRYYNVRLIDRPYRLWTEAERAGK
jgi:adenylate cyclase